MVFRDEPKYLFAGAVPAGELVTGARGIVPDLIVEDLELSRSTHDVGATPQHQAYLLDFKMMHVGSQHYQTRAARHQRGHAARARAQQVSVQYTNKARLFDERYNGVSAEAVRLGTAEPGPCLSVLRRYRVVRGLIFGPYLDASDEVHEFAAHIATVGATRDWRKMGARDVSEARGIILQLIFREWGIESARASARMRIERIRFISGEANGRRGSQEDRPTQATVDAWEVANDYAQWRGADYPSHPSCAGEV